MFQNIDAIIFDLGGVILNIDYQLTSSAFKKLGLTNFDELYSQAKQNHIFNNLEKGLIESDEFRNYVISSSGLSLNKNEIDHAWNAMLLDLPIERINLLNRLKKQFKIYLYSNTNAIHLNGFQKIIKSAYGAENLLEETFHKTYYSHIINKRKPNEDGFLQILKEQNLIAERTLFIDDSPQHIVGAKKLGIKAFLLKDEDIISFFKNY